MGYIEAPYRGKAMSLKRYQQAVEAMELAQQGQTYADIAHALRCSRGKVAGLIRDHARLKARYQLATPAPTAPGNVIRLASSPLAVPNVIGLEQLDDRDRWNKALARLMTRKRFLVIEHLCDIHFPFHDPAVMAADYHRLSLTQPDIIVRGSDEDDNPNISRYVEEGSEEPEIGDFLDVMQQYRAAHTQRLLEIVPGALQVNIEGNHGWPRFVKWGNKNNRKPAKTSDRRRYIQNVRCEGEVMWIGAKQSVVIDSLLVQHGKSHAKHTAHANAVARNFRYRGIMSGHTHRPQTYVVGDVVSDVSGCRCRLPEPYVDDEGDDYTPHRHSAHYAILDTVTGAADIKRAFYHADIGGGVWFEFGGKVYEVDAPAEQVEQRRAA